MPTPLLPVEFVPSLKDNYVWLFPTGPETMAAIDPGEAEPVSKWLYKHKKNLSHLLITHHHADHIGGIEALRAEFGAKVVGCKTDANRLPSLDHPVAEKDHIRLGDRHMYVREVPGHTTGHVIYFTEDVVFTGDTLFSLGCGRLFEGSPATMWQSLQKIRALDENFWVFPAHEYTLNNLKFTQSLTPGDPDLETIQAHIFALTDRGQPTLPSTLAWEKKYNPFLRADDAAFAKKIGLEHRSPVEVFTAIREARNRF